MRYVDQHGPENIDITCDTPLVDVLAHKSKCNMSGRCCSHGSGIVLNDDKERIATHLKLPIEEFENMFLEPIEFFGTHAHKIKVTDRKILDTTGLQMPHGRCAFLKGKECGIHQVKPLHCQLMTCTDKKNVIWQWFLYNHFVKDDQSRSEWETFTKHLDYVIGGNNGKKH